MTTKTIELMVRFAF